MDLTTTKLWLFTQVLLILSILLENSAAVKVCPPKPGLMMYGDYCFHKDNTNRTQGEAEAYCAGYGSTLPYPTGDLSEWQETLAEAIPNGLGPWSGATLQSDGEWKWPNGTRVPDKAFSFFLSGSTHPDDPNPVGNCTDIGDVSGQLFNHPCDGYRTVLCQVPSVNSCGCIGNGYLLVISLLAIQLLAVHMPTFTMSSFLFG